VVKPASDPAERPAQRGVEEVCGITISERKWHSSMCGLLSGCPHGGARTCEDAAVSLIRRRETAVIAAVLVACAVALAIWWPRGDDVPARERHYQATTACLLTDDQGLTGAPAQAAWSVLRQVSDQQLVKVQYLSITGPQTAANGLAYFNSLGMQKCTTIVAVGSAPIAALNQGRAQFPDVEYITVGGKEADVDATSAEAIRAGLADRLG
jgi:hypothetical protein